MSLRYEDATMARFCLTQIYEFLSEDVEGLLDDDGEVNLPSFFREEIDS